MPPGWQDSEGKFHSFIVVLSSDGSHIAKVVETAYVLSISQCKGTILPQKVLGMV